MDKESGYILIGTVSAILLIFLLGFLVIVLIYRKRKLEHIREIEIMNEKFSKELLQTQLEVQQQTMLYIGREIHDNIGQKLTLAALYSQQIDHEKLSPQINGRIVEVSNIINESLSELRSLSKNLTSDYIGQTSLNMLIKNECDKINAGDFCLVNFNGSVTDIHASYNVKNIITRIIQEFMQNSLKHAECSVINISIAENDYGLKITAADNGKGFHENEATGRGIGLTNIKKRAEAIGVSLTLTSEPGAGTNMQVLVPADKMNL